MRDADKGAGEQAAVPAGPPPPLPPAAYAGEYRKYGREQFEEVSKSLAGAELAKPDALEQLGADAPICREAPSVELAPPSVAEA